MNSYILRTAGDEVIAIDGGMEGDAPYLRGFLAALGNRVDAWFISHPHLDHVDALTAILRNPAGLHIDALYGSLPDESWMREHEDGGSLGTLQSLNAALEESGHTLQELYPGQRIEFVGATFEILGVRNPELTANAINNQSAVWRIDGGGKSILFLGDLGIEGGEKLLAGPYRHRLKADYVQMAHHGQSGVNESFYQAVDPAFVLWPTPDWLWENDSGQGRDSGPWETIAVRTWMAKLNIEKHFVSKDGVYRIDL
jgi:beta-lactamase superfamily II metal-dependent hydrolase